MPDIDRDRAGRNIESGVVQGRSEFRHESSPGSLARVLHLSQFRAAVKTIVDDVAIPSDARVRIRDHWKTRELHHSPKDRRAKRNLSSRNPGFIGGSLMPSP